MPNPQPKIHVFQDGDDFNDPATIALFNQNVLAIKNKFGALTANDLDGTALDPDGPLDFRGNALISAVEVGTVVNAHEHYEKTGETIEILMQNMTTGGIVFVPNGITVSCSSPILMQDDVQIVGVGNGSRIHLDNRKGNAPTGFNVIESNGAKRWALRNVRIDGDRTTFNSGNGVFISNLASADVTIENVFFGPRFEGNWWNGHNNHAISITNASDVKILGCFIHRSGGAAIRLMNARTITISENRAVENQLSVSAQNSHFLILENNEFRRSSDENVFLEDCTFVIGTGSQFQNASTGTAGAKDNLFLHATSNLVITNNHFDDPISEPDIGSSPFAQTRSTRYHINSSATVLERTRDMILTGNWFEETSSFVDGSIGKLLNLVTGTNVEATPATDSGYVRDLNKVVPRFRDLSWYDGGWRGGRIRAWKVRNVAEHPTIRWEKDFSENMSLPGYVSPDRGAYPWTAAPELLDYWTETGAHADREFMAFLPTDYLPRLSNPGSLLTPAVISSGMTDLADEIQAIQATYNVVEFGANTQSRDPKGLLKNIGTPGNPIYVSSKKTTGLWGEYAWGDSGAGMGQAVLSADIRVAPGPYAWAGDGHDQSPGGKLIVIWGGNVYGGNGAPGVTVNGVPSGPIGDGGLGGGSFGQRPTWATVHT